MSHAYGLKCKKDSNHTALVNHALSLGFEQLDTSRLKKKCDVILMRNGHVFFCEVKNPETKGKLNQDQKVFRDQIKKAGCNWVLLEYEKDINELFKLTL